MRVACLWFQKTSLSIPIARVAEHCLRFSPQICVRAEEAVFIEIGKCRKLFSEPGFLMRAQVVLRRLSLNASIAIGSDIAEALVLAKYGVSKMDLLPLEALLDLADPFAVDPVLQK